MTIRSLLSTLAAVSILTLTSPLPTPLHAAHDSGATGDLPAQAAAAPARSLAPMALTQSAVYTFSLNAQVTFTDQRWSPAPAWSSIQISARVPALAMDGPVAVETDRGISNGSPFYVGGSSAVPDESGEGTTWAATASGQITSNTTWSQNVLITGDVTVTGGVTLTISPGVTVFFAAHSDDQAAGYWTNKSELHVYGTLIAEGTRTAPIYFTSNAADKVTGDWGAISIRKDSTTSSLKNCVVHYAENGVRFFSENEGGGTLSAAVSNCRISQNGAGIYMRDLPDYPSGGTVTVNPTIANNLITDNIEYGIYLEAGTGYGTANNYAVVRNNVVEGNGWGLMIFSGTWWQGHADNYPQIVNNTIRYNANYGIYVQAYGSVDGSGADTDVSPTIENNLFENNSDNLYLLLTQPYSSGTQNYLHPVVHYNTIRNAMNGITVDDSQPRGVISPTVSHNVFYGMTGYAVNNVTTRTITLGDNYWGDSEAEWDAGPQAGDTYGSVVVGSHLTSSSPPILTRVEPAAASAGTSVTLYGANFGPPPPRTFLPSILSYPYFYY
jgi:hypothetical protein